MFTIYEYFQVTGDLEVALDFRIYFVLLYIATIFGILIQDGTMFNHLLVKFQMTVFLKVGIRYEYESLILALYEQEINQHLSMSSNQKLETMVKRHSDQKIRTRIFEVRNQRIETGVLAKTR